MSERLGRDSSTGAHPRKMETDLSPKKTLMVLVIVVGCFAVLWPKVFHPMLVGSADQYMKPSPIDKTTGCCDVISENDVNTIKVMSELCGSIITTNEGEALAGKELIKQCRKEVFDICGIDITLVLQEQVRLGTNVKQILNEIRSLNGSLCLKYNFGIAPWRLGVPHRIHISAKDQNNIRQERPHHLRSELVHPAFRERGRAIPQPQVVPQSRPPPRMVEGRPGPIPGMKPILGGAGHVVPTKQGSSSMSVIMPIYTIGIVIFFTYTLMKVVFRKQPQGVGGELYPPVDSDANFRKEVFEHESSRLSSKYSRDNISSKLGDAELTQLRQRLRETEMAMERIVDQMSRVPLRTQDVVNSVLSNGDAHKQPDEDQPTVKILGIEMTASCEGGKKWTRPESPILPVSSSSTQSESSPPPQEIYLEGALPAQSQLLVSESAVKPEPTVGEDPAVILSGKMTLSVISVDSETGVEEVFETLHDEDIKKENLQDFKGEVVATNEIKTEGEALESFDYDDPKTNIAQEPIDETMNKEETINEGPDLTQSTSLEDDIEKFLLDLKKSANIEMPVFTFNNDNSKETVEVNMLEKEVDDLIKAAIESAEMREMINSSESPSNNNYLVQHIEDTELEADENESVSTQDLSEIISEEETKMEFDKTDLVPIDRTDSSHLNQTHLVPNTAKFVPQQQSTSSKIEKDFVAELDLSPETLLDEKNTEEISLDELNSDNKATKTPHEEVNREKVSPGYTQEELNRAKGATEAHEEVNREKVSPDYTQEELNRAKDAIETQEELNKENVVSESTQEELNTIDRNNMSNTNKSDELSQSNLTLALRKTLSDEGMSASNGNESGILESKHDTKLSNTDNNTEKVYGNGSENVKPENDESNCRDANSPKNLVEIDDMNNSEVIEELESDEEIEEIEEVEYEEEVEEEEVEEEEDGDDEGFIQEQRVLNGERSKDNETSKEASSALTAAEGDASDIDEEEELSDEEEIIEIVEEEESDEDENVANIENDVGHVL